MEQETITQSGEQINNVSRPSNNQDVINSKKI
jgi:hypothetical protein